MGHLKSVHGPEVEAPALYDNVVRLTELVARHTNVLKLTSWTSHAATSRFKNVPEAAFKKINRLVGNSYLLLVHSISTKIYMDLKHV